MKKYFIIGVIFSLTHFYSTAQNSQRVIRLYENSSEFKEGQNTFNLSKSQSRGYKVRLNELFNRKYINVMEGNKKSKILKENLFGYLRADKTSYRFFKNKPYKILNATTQLIIYHMNLPQQYTGKTNATRYCYSIGFDGEIKTLTIKNLLNDFNTNFDFCNSIKA